MLGTLSLYSSSFGYNSHRGKVHYSADDVDAFS